VRAVTRSLEPRHFAAFRCLGADCEDTCCDGWAVTIDKPTFEKYQHCPDAQWRDSFQNLIAINTSNPTDHDYARIQLTTTTCPFLADGLCSIHKNLGEAYLSVTCASFPRVWNVVDGVLEKSLDLGCPEAARRVLLDQQSLAFVPGAVNGQDFSAARVSAIDSSAGDRPGKPFHYFPAVRDFVLWLLQNRTLPVWKRVLLLGFFCDKLQETAATADAAPIPDLLEAYRSAISGGLFEDALQQLPANPVVRLESVLELIVARITSDFTNRRFLDCYKQFMDGISWGPNSTMDEISSRYQAAHAQYYAPFLSRHEFMLEHYLVNYVCRTLFPFGPQESTYRLRDQNIERSIHGEFVLMAVYFAIIETLLCGMAGFHKDAFGPAQVVQVIYTFTRTFEHSLAFPDRVIRALDEKGLNHIEGIAVLVKN
jgi:lysine-N-methylase